MKKLLSLFILMLLPMLASAQTVSDVENSGCVREARGPKSEPVPTIILTKEGSVLSVQLLNYQSDCCTEDFNVTSNISGGSNGEPCSIAISVVPVYGGCDCICPYNVSFIVRDLEPNSFYLNCWWYKGQVELTEGEPLVLEDAYEDVVVDGMNFTLRKAFHEAMLTRTKWVGEVRIPSELIYEGQTYSVTSIDNDAFTDNTTLTKVYIPQTIKGMDFYSGINMNPFAGCSALKSIEVEEGNPILCTVDGVLFNKEKTRLYCFPAADSRTSYTVPKGVTWIDGSAFAYNHHLVSISLPDEVTSLGASAFYDCTNLEEVNLSSNLKTLAGYLFWNCKHLKSVIIPKGVTYLGINLFNGCTSLTSVTMPESVTSVDTSIFENCTSLKSVKLSPNLDRINHKMFLNCSSLADIQIPKSVISVWSNAFEGCKALKTLDLPESVTRLGDFVFSGCKLDSLFIWGIIDFRLSDHYWLFDGMGTQTKVYVQPSQVDKYKAIYKGPVYPLPEQKVVAYRPFVEDGKVWKVGSTTGIWDGIVKMVEYYYFDGDTIINGKTCKQMMCQRYVSPNHPDYAIIVQSPSLNYIGAWYEEDKEVYMYNEINQLRMMYDFSLDANETILIDNYPYVIGPEQTGGLKGFKGVYRDVMWRGDEDPYYCTTWLEGVGGIDGPTVHIYFGKENHGLFLMSCTVGDEVIYLNDEYEDGTLPDDMEAKKHRFDFTHTVKTQPRMPTKRVEEAQSLYGEYSNLRLGINLDPLDAVYQVRITNESGKVVYEKNINAGSIVALDIDISTYAEGRYTVTVENSHETFSGEFEMQTTGIEEVRNKHELVRGYIYNLQGQRISSLRKGLNIVNGKKIFVK